MTRARLRAWWEGEDFDAEAAAAAIANDSAPETGDADRELFDEPPFDLPPRLTALSRLWGEGRIRPGDATSEALDPARVDLQADGVLALLSPGLIAPVAAVAGVHPGKIEVFEWREETLEALKYGVRKASLEDRVSVTRIDIEAHIFTPNHYDGLISIDDIAYTSFPPHFAQQVMKCLKPGACAVIECYAGLPSAELATAFASSFAEPQIRAHGDVLQHFSEVGLKLESDEDLTEEFLAHAREGFRRLGEALGDAAKFDADMARELAWEAEAWKMRLKLLAQRRLERRRFVFRRPADSAAPEVAPAQAETANAPQG
ncbi:hypothetical protein [Terricaulis sp.]|uniref:hypothetical protein n=1 Tax=Terricaulis sp. TaxID=2768686 RepID=UPI003783D7E6